MHFGLCVHNRSTCTKFEASHEQLTKKAQWCQTWNQVYTAPMISWVYSLLLVPLCWIHNKLFSVLLLYSSNIQACLPCSVWSADRANSQGPFSKWSNHSFHCIQHMLMAPYRKQGHFLYNTRKDGCTHYTSQVYLWLKEASCSVVWNHT